MIDVLVVGAGPAGAAAALVAARAGARTVMVDRASFPRDKLCGDTLSPGALVLLRRLGVGEAVEGAGLALQGMVVGAHTGLAIEADYGPGVHGRALPRRSLDLMLVEAAAAAGAELRERTRVVEPLVEHGPEGPVVVGVIVEMGGRRVPLEASVTIAADGRRSSLAFGLGLARHPRRPRRWAIGAGYEGVSGLGSRGEMHIRRGHYVGIAPLPDGLANVCLVVPACPGLAAPTALLESTLEADPVVAARFRLARRASAVTSLGPLAVDAAAAGTAGLLLAGDAAGFVDPMTGDGVRLALDGGRLAAETALECLERPAVRARAHVCLLERRRAAFGRKLRLNRALRWVVDSPWAVGAGARVAPLLPSVVQALVRQIGDVGLAGSRSAA